MALVLVAVVVKVNVVGSGSSAKMKSLFYSSPACTPHKIGY